MATPSLELVEPSRSSPCSDDDREENLTDDTNNNAHNKTPKCLIVLKRHVTQRNDSKLENDDSQSALVVNESQSDDDDYSKDDVSVTTSEIVPSVPDDSAGASKALGVISGLEFGKAKDGIDHGKKFSDYFSHLSSVSVSGGKATAASGGSVTSELDNISKYINQDLDQSLHIGSPLRQSQVTSEASVSGILPPAFEADSNSRMKQKGGLQSGQSSSVKPRCTPAREAVDPAKYFTLTDEPDGTKYACSKCGNVYKWRKSLNKHWKEKHDGETPSLHARPPPSLLHRERFLNPLRPPAKHSIFHPSTYHSSSGHGKSSAPVITPPRLQHLFSGGKNTHSMSQYLFGKFPIKDEGRDIVKMMRQLEEPVTAVVRPNRSSQSPIPLSSWTGWLSSPNKPIADFPKLKVPALDSIKSAHDHSRPKDIHSAMFSAIQPHHTLRGGPLDLSGTLVSRGADADDSILDLSCKTSDSAIPTDKGNTDVQDEPLDFSIKQGSTKSSDVPNRAETDPYHGWFSILDRKDSAHRSMGFTEVGTISQGPPFPFQNLEKPNQVLCASCHVAYNTMSELNHHFIRHHMNVIYEAAVETTTAGSQRGSQLQKPVTMDASKRLLACVVCGMSVQWSWMLTKHFEQSHSSIRPNPYKKAPAASLAAASSLTIDCGEIPSAFLPLSHRCESCLFSTDSVTEFARHQLKHSLTKEKKEQERSRHLGDEKDAILKRGDSNERFEQFADGIIDLEGESTAIVIPQAPEETSVMRNKSQNDAAVLNDLQFDGMSSCEGSVMISGENTAIVIPQAPEETSLGSSQVYVTPPGSKSGRGKKETGSSTENLLPFKCELCEYRARWPSEMMQHMKNHSDEKPYQCPQCSYRSKWKWDVVKHLKRCGGGGSVKDVIDTTQKKKSFVKSLLVESQCRQTGYDGSHSYSLANFRSNYDHTGSPKSLLKGSQNVTICSSIPDVVNSPDETGNMENCDSEDTVSEDLSTSNKMDAQGSEVTQSAHACVQCPFVGHSPAELKRHLRVHSDEKPYSCRTCSYSSKWKCDLKKHLKAYNHISAVPLIYGGHGRKPITWLHIANHMSQASAAGNNGKTAEEGESDLRELLQGAGGPRGKKRQGSSSDNGNIFGGITTGGRLKCKQCEYEAIDITSFLQHKKMHRSLGFMVKSRDEGSAKLTPPSQHHRRKSFKQIRVPQTIVKDCKENVEVAVNGIGEVETDEFSGENKTFWECLGLRSTSSFNHGRQSSVDGSDENLDDPESSDMDTEVDSLHGGSPLKRPRYDSPRGIEFMKQSSLTSSNSYESNTDTEADAMDMTEAGNARERQIESLAFRETKDGFRADAMEVKVLPTVKPVFTQVRRGIRQGVTTTEAEDAAGMSKRKRKLRTCEKCGYITDNLTTLQRHAAKHGSSGRHRCWMCDYSVDRQHVLDYHIKIVHEGAGREVENKVEKWDCGIKTEVPNSTEKRQLENLSQAHQNSERRLSVDRGSFGGKRKIVCTTSLITIRGHEMEMIQKGNKTWYNCIKCQFVSSNITNAVNHAKQHGASKKYKCKYCDYSLDRKSSIANHMNSQHGHSESFQFDLESERYAENSAVDWMTELNGSEPQGRKFLLLDKMNGQWKKDVCVKCGFCSMNSVQMVLHRLAHGSLDKEFGCSMCKRFFSSPRLLDIHIKSHDQGQSRAAHLENEEVVKDLSEGQNKPEAKTPVVATKFQCPFCPFVSIFSSKFVVHLKHHQSVKKHACNKCSFRANVRNVLYHHAKLHH